MWKPYLPTEQVSHQVLLNQGFGIGKYFSVQSYQKKLPNANPRPVCQVSSLPLSVFPRGRRECTEAGLVTPGVAGRGDSPRAMLRSVMRPRLSICIRTPVSPPARPSRRVPLGGSHCARRRRPGTVSTYALDRLDRCACHGFCLWGS